MMKRETRKETRNEKRANLLMHDAFHCGHLSSHSFAEHVFFVTTVLSGAFLVKKSFISEKKKPRELLQTPS